MNLKAMHVTRYRPKGYSLLISIGLLMLIGLLTACSTQALTSGNGPSGTPTVGSTPTPTPSPTSMTLPAALPLLQKSIQAARQIQTAHVLVQGKGTLQTSAAFLPAFSQETAFTVAAHGDIALPKQEEQMHVRVTLTPPGQQPLTIKEAEVLAGQKLFLQGPSHQWFVVDLAAVLGQASVYAGVLPQPQDLLPLEQHITVVDHGTSMQGGKQIQHLTLIADTQTLAQLASAIGQPMVSQVLGSIHLPTPISVDLFLEDTTGLPERIELSGKMEVNVDMLLAALPGKAGPPPAQHQQARTLVLTFALRVQLSKFNEPVNIHVPAQATPLPLVSLPSGQ